MTVHDFLQQLFAHMGVEGVDIVEDESGETHVISLVVPEEESGMMIGRRGETLEALQRVLRLVFQKDGDKPLVLNINQFREQREEYLVDLASRLASTVASSGQPYHLRLPANERRIVHMTLSEHADVVTESEGEGIDRVLVIKPKTA